MPFNGSGVFNRLYSWVSDANANIDILPDRMDNDTNDIAQGLMHALTVNGETIPVANLPMNNFRHTGASAGVADTDYATLGQIKNGGGGLPAGGYLPVGGGTIASLGVTGSLNAGSLTVSGGTTLQAVSINGQLSYGNFSSNGTGSIAGNLTVTGGITAGAMTVNGLLSTVGLTVNGQLTYGNFSSNGSGTIGGNLTVNGAVSIGSTLTVNQLETVGGTLTVNGALTVNGNPTALGNATTSGFLHVGTDLVVSGTSTFNGAIFANGSGIALAVSGNIIPSSDNGGAVGQAGNSFALMSSYSYITASDRDDKADIEVVPIGCLDLVRAIAARTYRIPGTLRLDPMARHWGFVAQEVQAAMAAAGREFAGHFEDAETGHQGLSYDELLAVLWGAVQELAAAQPGA